MCLGWNKQRLSEKFRSALDLLELSLQGFSGLVKMKKKREAQRTAALRGVEAMSKSVQYTPGAAPGVAPGRPT